MISAPLLLLRRNLLPEWTTGVLSASGIWRDRIGTQRLFTLELPWLDNQQYISCIPPKKASESYFVKPDNHGRWQYFKVYDHEGNPTFDKRSGIEFHPLKSYLGSEGCIGVSTHPANSSGIFENHTQNCRDALGTLRTWIRGYPGFYMEVSQ